MTTHDDEKTIREIMTGWSAAVRAGDATRAVAPMAEKVTHYALRPPLELRDAAARNSADLEEWFATWEELPEITTPDPTVVIDGDLAVVFGLSRMRGTKRDEGPVDLWYRTTLCLQRQRGEWKVIHEHASVPFLMDGSDKAALHLQPERTRI